MRTFTNKKAVPVKQTAKQKLQYVRKNWQLYLVSAEQTENT